MEIKRVAVNDVDKLQKIATDTFIQTFSLANTKENMDKYVKEELSIEKLTEELHDNNSEFYFCMLHTNVIGYLKINYRQSQTELREDDAVEIERIYVLKDFHRKKVGTLLYEKALEVARQRNSRYVWLGVWEENHRAINFYKKNGFVEFDKHLFKLGNDEQTDIMMKLELHPET